MFHSLWRIENSFKCGHYLEYIGFQTFRRTFYFRFWMHSNVRRMNAKWCHRHWTQNWGEQKYKLFHIFLCGSWNQLLLRNKIRCEKKDENPKKCSSKKWNSKPPANIVRSFSVRAICWKFKKHWSTFASYIVRLIVWNRTNFLTNTTKMVSGSASKHERTNKK